jgi:hypothetical protein
MLVQALLYELLLGALLLARSLDHAQAEGLSLRVPPQMGHVVRTSEKSCLHLARTIRLWVPLIANFTDFRVTKVPHTPVPIQVRRVALLFGFNGGDSVIELETRIMERLHELKRGQTIPQLQAFLKEGRSSFVLVALHKLRGYGWVQASEEGVWTMVRNETE